MDKLSKVEKLKVISLIMVISGIFGFIYEVIFYRIDLGYFVNRGTTIGPWIPMYAFGGLFIYLLTYKYKDKPFIVFLLSTIICGIFEFIVGYLLFHIGHIRLWDYNVEIWNFLNIGGYICLRSVLFFGVSGVFLIKVIFPLVLKLKSKISKMAFDIISIFPAILFLLDFIITRF